MNTKFYNTYLYRYPQDVSYGMIEKSLSELNFGIQISIHDISDNLRAEQNRIIYGMFMAERMRVYEKDKQKECYVHIIRISEKGYIAIVSAYPEGRLFANVQSILTTICRATVISYVDADTKNDECRKYWTKHVKEFAHTLTHPNKERYAFDGEEFLPIDIDEIEELKEMFRDNPMRAKSLLTCALARIVLAKTDQESIVIEDHFCYGKLNRMPIRICDLTSEIPIKDAADDFNSAYKYSNITYDEICASMDINIDEYLLYSQTILYDGMFEKIYKDTEVGRIYRFDALNYADTPLFVVFHMNGDMASVRYLYDTAFFRGYDMNGLHNAFKITLRKLLHLDYTVTDYKPYFNIIKSADEKRVDAIAGCFKKSGWFDDFSENELIRLATKSKVKRMFQGQNFIDAGTTEDSVYLLVHGKVEVVGRDNTNTLHTLRIVKEMNFFGIEALTEDSVAADDYQVMTDDALAVVIDRDTFLEEASEHNELFIKSISQLNSNVIKYQKLWMMS